MKYVISGKHEARYGAVCVCMCVYVSVSHQCSNYFIHVLIMHCYPIMFFKVLYENKENTFCLMYDLRGLRY